MVGWGVLVLVVAPQNYTLGSAGVFCVGLGRGLLAQLLGGLMRRVSKPWHMYFAAGAAAD